MHWLPRRNLTAPCLTIRVILALGLPFRCVDSAYFVSGRTDPAWACGKCCVSLSCGAMLLDLAADFCIFIRTTLKNWFACLPSAHVKSCDVFSLARSYLAFGLQGLLKLQACSTGEKKWECNHGRRFLFIGEDAIPTRLRKGHLFSSGMSWIFLFSQCSWPSPHAIRSVRLSIAKQVASLHLFGALEAPMFAS